MLEAFSYGPIVKNSVQLKSPVIDTDSRTCARFCAIFNSSLPAILNVFFKEVDKEMKRVLSITRDGDNEITKISIPLPKMVRMNLIVESLMDNFGHKSYVGSFSLENDCLEYESLISVNCSFESQILCGYLVEYKSHGFSWIRIRRNFVPSGPEFDHTFKNISKKISKIAKII